MHVRVNIPAWGWQEPARCLAALRGGRSHRERLREELRRSVPGWEPVLLASARYGIALAVRWLGLQGRRIAVPGYVCPAVLTGLDAAPAEPVAIDCAASSTQFEVEALTRAVRAGTVDAILAANTYGMDQDFSLLAAMGLPVIEDAAYQAGWLEPEGTRPCGTRAQVGVWSFNFKALTGVGGGILWLPEGSGPPPDAVPSRVGPGDVLRMLDYSVRGLARHRIPRWLPGAAAPALGLGASVPPALAEPRAGAMSEPQAAVALTQWTARAELLKAQTANTALVAAAVARAETLTPVAGQDGRTMAHLFPCVVRSRGQEAPGTVHHVRQVLHAHGIQTAEPYPVVLGGRSTLPNAHDLASRLVLVPCNASLGSRQIGQVAAALEGASSRRAQAQ